MLEQYIAISDYTKREESDITLKAGNVVEVIEKNEHGELVKLMKVRFADYYYACKVTDRAIWVRARLAIDNLRNSCIILRPIRELKVFIFPIRRHLSFIQFSSHNFSRAFFSNCSCACLIFLCAVINMGMMSFSPVIV